MRIEVKMNNKFPPLKDMSLSGKILKRIFTNLKKMIVPGITTASIDICVSETLCQFGATSPFLGYDGFPAACCVSINDEVVHCVPGPRVLCEGDIVSVDVGAELNGAITDACRTYVMGRVPRHIGRLVRVTRNAMLAGISEARAGNHIGDISNAIQRVVEFGGYNVSREYVGHGVGAELHMKPWIPNYGKKETGDSIEPGMCLAIEPIVFDGSWKTKVRSDGGVITVDGNFSAHFENTVYIGENETLVLT